MNQFKQQALNDAETVDAVEGFCQDITGEFPFDVFPSQLRDLIPSIAESYCVNPEPVAAAMLTILSAALGNSIRVSPKEGWDEPPFIWHVVIGDSGSGKTPFMSRLLQPVDRLQRKAAIGARPKEEPASPSRLETLKHYLVSDITVEALADVMKDTPRGILAFHDELSGFIRSHDMYKGKGNDRQKYIELWNCRPWKVDRVQKGSKYIADTGCSILGGMQPQLLSAIFKQDQIYDGLLPRFTFSRLCERGYSKRAVKEADMEVWGDMVRSCHAIPLEQAEGIIRHRIIRFSDAAHEVYSRLPERYAFMCNDGRLRVFIPKLRSYAVRIAGILHVMNDGNDEISPRTMRDSIRVVDYFLKQAKWLLSHYGQTRQLYSEDQTSVLSTLKVLFPKVRKGKLALSEVVDALNKDRPEELRLVSQDVAYILRGMDLRTKLVGGYSYLEWESQKLNRLFLEY